MTQKMRISENPLVAFGMWVFSFCVLVSLGVWLQNLLGKQADSLSGWAQAVGSVGAIFAAVWISRNQQRQEKRKRETDQAHARYVLEAEIVWLSHDIIDFSISFLQWSRESPITSGYLSLNMQRCSRV